ncbi:MAG: aspartate-semialdehyde dehydrogenase [Chlamydiia bacterium]|nr:aspartate-semialdehyde dehydrogenase [Chlamydiia bacterium]
MNVDFYFRKKIPVAILGATGLVGQKFVELLANHPWFEIDTLVASEKSAGKKYGEAVDWKMATPLPQQIASMPVRAYTTKLDVSVCFSALDSSVAKTLERELADAGYAVISNTSSHRMDPDVTLVVPEVNPEHLDLVKDKKGFIVTNPNCVVIGLVMALKPLVDQYGVEAVHVSTMQAISGAGLQGALLDVDDNVIPYIADEESKVESEPKKILSAPDLVISAHCNRVHVSDGHLENLSVRLKKEAVKQDIIDMWNSFRGEPQGLQLPSAPANPLIYHPEEDQPQPKKTRHLEKGMAVSIGRLRPCPNFGWKFSILSHNTVRGAAGCAVLNAEMLVKRGLLFW